MKKSIANFMTIIFLMVSNVSYSQWTLPNAQGNINNTNAGSVIFNGTIDQRNFTPSGVPLDPNGGTTAQVNANLGGLTFKESATVILLYCGSGLTNKAQL